MKCKFCKEEIVDDSKFCPSCGRRLDDDDKLDYEDEENQTEENVDDSDENQEELNTDQDEEENSDEEDYDDEDEIYKDINELLEELGPPRENKIGKIIGFALIAIIVASLAFLGIKKYKDSQIKDVSVDLSYYLDIKAEGESGAASLDIKLNKASFVADFEGRIYNKKNKEVVSSSRLIDDIEKTMRYAISKEHNLENGDEVNVRIVLNYNKYKDLNIIFADKGKDYKVEGLKESAKDIQAPEEDKKEEDKKKEKEKEKKEDKSEQNSDKKKEKYDKYIKDHIKGNSTISITSSELMGKAIKSKDEIYVYKIRAKEKLGQTTKAFDYYVGLHDKGKNVELIKGSLTHRSLDEKENTLYDIDYEGFALVDDLLSSINNGNLKIKDLIYYDNFKAKESMAGYYFLEGYTLFLDNDKNVKLINCQNVYTGKWSKNDKTVSLDIKSYSPEPIKANIAGDELEFDADVFK
ncbi:zinc ribbon domain-containing protein [Anaerococcus tetradius]|uniref:zinc ribbon domain-containing protein n=1 Tax=Anaerococcus tetradius TaxID=33036 RepID=UPI0023F0CD01|nr:zinc ribbon domain-containing protein [Anaerococcus tetradius]